MSCITTQCASRIYTKSEARSTILQELRANRLSNMKSFVVVVALVACALAGPVREKRGFLSGLYSSDFHSAGYGHYHGYDAPVVSLVPSYSHYAPAAKVVSVDKVVNSHHVVDVPQVVNVRKVVSVPQVVSVNKVVAAPSYSSYSSGLGSGYGSGWNSGYGSGWSSGSYHGLW